MNILIVDDEIPAVQGILKIISWESLGIDHVYTAYSMKEAIGHLLLNEVEILLTDIEMLGGTGFDLIQWVNDHHLQCISIILSSFPNFQYAQKAITLGVFEYLLKPVEDKRLETTIKRALQLIASTQNEVPNSNSTIANPLIDRAKNYIHDNISTEISRNDIANFVGLNPEYLSTIFHRETGQTLSDFIKIERIHFAMQFLKQTNLPISIISENVGYDSLSYFSMVFKQVTGLTPREYRKKEIETSDLT